MYERAFSRVRRFGIYLGAATGVMAAALTGSPLACADDSPASVDASALAALGDLACTDICGTSFGPYLPYFPFEFAQIEAPATDYTDVAALYVPNGLADATGFEIASGHTNLVSEGAVGVAGETVLYTVNDGVVSAPIELLPFDLPL